MLRMMSYNIQAGRGSDGRFDLPRTAAAISAERPDVVALQEVDVRWSARSDNFDEAAWLAEELGMRASFAPIYTRPPDGRFGLAVLSRFPIASVVNHPLTRVSTQTPDAKPEAMPGFLEVLLEVPGAPLRIYDTHLDYRDAPEVRAIQVREMLRIVGERPGVLCGDFNAPPGAAELAPLWTMFTDALTTNDFTYPADRPTKRFDYVITPAGLALHEARVPDTLASDHRPVVGDLRTA